MSEMRDSGRQPNSDFSVCRFLPSPDIQRHETLGWLATLLVAAQAENRLPRPDEVTPRRIGAAALPSILLLDVTGQPARYRIRLAGTKLTRLSGRDSTGCFFDELADHHGEAQGGYLALLDRIVQQREALLVTVEMYYRKQSWQHFEALCAPLEAVPGRVDRIVMTVAVPTPARPVRRPY